MVSKYKFLTLMKLNTITLLCIRLEDKLLYSYSHVFEIIKYPLTFVKNVC